MINVMSLSGPARRPTLFLLSLGLFAAVLVGAFVVDDPAEAVTVLFVVPIALSALADGQRGGLGAAVFAAALLVVWVVAADVPLGAAGWTSRLAAYFVIGGMVGRYESRARHHERMRLNHRHAGEVQDGVVQALVLARYELRRGGSEAAAAAVDEALAAGKRIISDRLADPEPGDLRLSRRGEQS